MKPGFIAMRKINANIIAREHLRSPHAIVATINTLVSPSTDNKTKKINKSNLASQNNFDRKRIRAKKSQHN